MQFIMPGNYGLNGNDWYNQRLNQIASMMSMQNTDPSYLAGALIGDILRTPFQNWIDNKVLPTLTGGGNSNNGSSNSNDTQFQQVNGTYQAEPTANNPATTGNRQTDVTIASLMPNQQGNVSFANTVQPGMDMDFTHLGQAQAQQSPPTQAEINEATNNATNQAVTQEAQRQGNMQGIMDNLGQGAINSAVANAFGISPFQQASSLGNGGEASYDEAMQNALLREIYKAKQDYAIAQQNNDTEGMQRANDAANLVRQMAREYGVDVSAGGSDVTIDDLADTILREQTRQQQRAQQREVERIRNMTPQELLQQPDITVSPNDFYQRAYQELNNKGIPEYRARQRASDMAMQYESRYMSELQNAMMTNGISNGSINDDGTALLARAVLANNPEMAQLYSSTYASPRDNYAFNQALQKAAITQQYNQANIDLKNRQAIDMLNRKTAAQKDIDRYRVALNTEKEDYMARLNSQLAGVKEEQKGQIRAQLLQRLKDAGYAFTPEEERNYILSGSVGRSSKNGTSSDDKTPTWAKGLNEQISKAQRTLDGDDIDELKDKIAANASEMTQDQLDFYNSVVLALLFKRAKDAGYEDEAAGYYQGIPTYLRGQLLPGY